VINLVLTGKLRSGDRLDRNEIARELGLSRVPVQEAVLQLEHDGIISTRYHRGAYVERFDEAAVWEHHELYGVLSGVASARAAAASDPAVITRLEYEIAPMRVVRDARFFDNHARRFRDIINDTYAGPRLHAAIESSQTMIPHALRQTYVAQRDELLPSYEAELTAIGERNPEAARGACAQRADVLARTLLEELVRRGVLCALHSD
jgi:DNA-binding GntR family transcriptional regulator